MDFFNDLGNQFNPKGDGFLSDIVHDSTFKDITGGVGDLFKTTLSGTTNLLKSVTTGMSNIATNLGNILGGSTIYLLIGVLGIGVLAYGYNSFKK